MGMDNVARCQHIKTNGTQCGSPALRWRRRCFFHENFRREQRAIASKMEGQRHFDLPLLEDPNSVQMALMKVIQMLGSGRIDHRTAGLMLYALQTASINLRHADFEARNVTHVVIDRDDVHRTCIDGPQWFEEDFDPEDKEEDEVGEAENEIEDEADKEAPAAAAPAQAASARKEPMAAKPLNTEEARLKAKGAVINWLLETAGQKAAVEPPG